MVFFSIAYNVLQLNAGREFTPEFFGANCFSNIRLICQADTDTLLAFRCCYLLRLFLVPMCQDSGFCNGWFGFVRSAKNKKRREGNFFSLGGKKQKLFCIFWGGFGFEKMQMCFVLGLDFFSHFF